jgi:predicted metal-dependent hydrolase
VLRIGERVHAYQTKLGWQPTTVRGLDFKDHCVFCTPQGKLNLHWKCIMAPLTVLDYIVMRELAYIAPAKARRRALERCGQSAA